MSTIAEPKISVGKTPARQSRHDRLFETGYLQKDLKVRSVKGGIATMSGQGAVFVIGTVSAMILARLLTPADFGLIAMVSALTGFAGLFKDLGLSMATIQRAEINHEQISTLFWLNMALSILFALIIGALAPAVAWFYGEPRLLRVTVANLDRLQAQPKWEISAMS